jgi:hypothetical protein
VHGAPKNHNEDLTELMKATPLACRVWVDAWRRASDEMKKETTCNRTIHEFSSVVEQQTLLDVNSTTPHHPQDALNARRPRYGYAQFCSDGRLQGALRLGLGPDYGVVSTESLLLLATRE